MTRISIYGVQNHSDHAFFNFKNIRAGCRITRPPPKLSHTLERNEIMKSEVSLMYLGTKNFWHT
jgi:hypothetical protein